MQPRNVFRRLAKDEEGQAMIELIIVVALVALALAWMTTALPAAIQRHFAENQRILSSPL